MSAKKTTVQVSAFGKDILTPEILSYDTIGKGFTKEWYPNRGKELKIARKNLEEALELYGAGNVFAAADLLKKVTAFNPDNLLVNVLLAKSLFRNVSTRMESEMYILKALALDSLNKEACFLKAALEVSKLHLEEALADFETLNTWPSVNDEDRKVIARRIAECKFAQERMAAPEKVKVENMGPTVNTVYPEYTPVVVADPDRMYITSTRPNESGLVNAYTGLAFEDIYRAQRSAENPSMWRVSPMTGELNTEKNDAIVGLTLDGQDLYVYSDIEADRFIYTSRAGKKDWSKIKPLEVFRGKDVTNSIIKSVAFSKDGKTVFFTSNAEGGIGGFDIYRAEIIEGNRWSKAENLGPMVNTTGNEMSVHLMSDDKTLVFTSNGLLGMGGYDIFYTQVDVAGGVTAPKNLGYPINTVENDQFFTTGVHENLAYYASDRLDSTIGNYDIYKIEFENMNEFFSSPVQIGVVQGKVTEPKKKSFVPVAVDICIRKQGSQESIRLKNNMESGEYHIQLSAAEKYVMEISHGKYLKEEIELDFSESKTLNYDIELRKK